MSVNGCGGVCGTPPVREWPFYQRCWTLTLKSQLVPGWSVQPPPGMSAVVWTLALLWALSISLWSFTHLASDPLCFFSVSSLMFRGTWRQSLAFPFLCSLTQSRLLILGSSCYLMHLSWWLLRNHVNLLDSEWCLHSAQTEMKRRCSETLGEGWEFAVIFEILRSWISWGKSGPPPPKCSSLPSFLVGKIWFLPNKRGLYESSASSFDENTCIWANQLPFPCF